MENYANKYRKIFLEGRAEDFVKHFEEKIAPLFEIAAKEGKRSYQFIWPDFNLPILPWEELKKYFELMGFTVRQNKTRGLLTVYWD